MTKGRIKQNKKKRARTRAYRKEEGNNWQGTIVFNNLPRAGDKKGYCKICRRSNNQIKAIATTTGKMHVFVCRDCGRYMRGPPE